MKTKKLNKIVKEWTDNIAEDVGVDENALAIHLLEEGATMALVNREMGKALIAVGRKDDPSIMRKAADEAVTELADVDALMDYTDVQQLVIDVTEKVNCDEKDAAAAVKRWAKKEEIDLPKKPKLGKVKTAIIDYFVTAAPEDYSIKNLAAHLEDAGCCNATKNETAEEAALRASRMNFAFAKMLVEINE